MVSSEGLYLPDSETGLVPTSEVAAILLGCAPQVVDILACGPNWVMYSIFDHEGAANAQAMAVLSQMTGYELNMSDDDQIMRGPVLLVCIQ